MALCRNCGAEIHDQAVICPHCGVEQKHSAAATANDTGSIGWSLLGCCVPIAGLILFLIWKDTQPKNAKKAGMGALISVILSVIFTILYVVLVGVLVGTSGYYY